MQRDGQRIAHAGSSLNADDRRGPDLLFIRTLRMTCFARRSTLLLGSQRANLARQLIALVLLGLWAHTLGQGLHGGAVMGILFISGIIGFGFGDWALFEAYPRIGSALTILLCQCLAAPIGAITEWLWLGTSMTWLQIVSSAVILLGVALALAPGHDSDIPHGHRVVGIICGIIAAAGQAWGAVLSRYAFRCAHDAGFFLDGITAAYQRIWGGVVSLLSCCYSFGNSPRVGIVRVKLRFVRIGKKAGHGSWVMHLRGLPLGSVAISGH